MSVSVLLVEIFCLKKSTPKEPESLVFCQVKQESVY